MKEQEHERFALRQSPKSSEEQELLKTLYATCSTHMQVIYVYPSHSFFWRSLNCAITSAQEPSVNTNCMKKLHNPSVWKITTEQNLPPFFLLYYGTNTTICLLPPHCLKRCIPKFKYCTAQTVAPVSLFHLTWLRTGKLLQNQDDTEIVNWRLTNRAWTRSQKEVCFGNTNTS